MMKSLLLYLLDIVTPIASFYACSALGLSTFWALVAGGALTAAVALVNTIRRGRLDRLGVLVLAEIALGIVLDLSVRDPRLTLARGSLFIAVAAVWVLAGVGTRRPATVEPTRPFALKKGGAAGGEAFDWLAGHDPRFLRVQRILSAVWGAAFLAYAVLRVIVIYASGTIAEALWVNEIPGALAVLVGMIASAVCGKRLEALVYERMDVTDPGRAGTARPGPSPSRSA